MRILVTGGAGFIGTHLCEFLLHQKHDVICIDDFTTSSIRSIEKFLNLPNFRLIQHDVCNPWKSTECDRIYHLACPASPVHYQRDPVKTIKTAFLGTLHALECAAESKARILITSTSEIYGDPLVHPQSESYFGNVNPIGVRSCYDEGKRSAESLATSWFLQYKTDVRITRLFNTYGPGLVPDDGRLIPNLILQAIRNKPMTIHGTGQQTRSLCYISDTVRGLNLVMEKAPSDPNPYNIGNPDERSVISIANDISNAFDNYSMNYSFYPLPQDDPKQRCPDISRIKHVCGWHPEIGYKEGLTRTIEWFKSTGIK